MDNLFQLPHSAALLKVIRALQCPICRRILRDPIALPCGQTLCIACVPKKTRTCYQCPLADCKDPHPVNFCSKDYVVEKILQGILAIANKGHDVGHTGGNDKAPITKILLSRRSDPHGRAPQLFKFSCSPIQILLHYAKSSAVPPSSSLVLKILDPPATMTSREKSLLNSAVQAIRPEVDCQICFEIFVRPVTIPCGHTFCTACLEQLPIPIQRCPICRRGLLSATFGSTNRTLEGILNVFWEDCLLDRKALAQAARESIDVTLEPMPIIPYYASAAPGMSLTLLLYDTKYRFTIKRLMEGNRVFGMVLPVLMTGTMSTNDQEFIHTGTLMHIEVLQQLAGGGCRIQAVALDRFAVRSYEWERGIAMAMVRKLDEFGN